MSEPSLRRGLQLRALLLVAFGMLAPLALLAALSHRGFEEASERLLEEREHLAQSIATQVAELAGENQEAGLARVRLLLKQYKRSDRTVMDVIDARGVVLASTEPERAPHPAEHGQILADLVRARKASKGSTSADEIFVFAPVPLLPWGVTVTQPRADAFAAVETLQRRVLWLTPLFLGIAAFFTWGAVRSVRKPLAVLTDAAERIASGDLARPIPPLPQDEVGRLGRSLETMRGALASSLEEVRRANVELEGRVADRTRELTRLYAELRDREERRARLLRKLLSAQEEERRRIARELHDETCQTIAALVVGLDMALSGPSPDAARARLQEVRSLATHALDDLHRVIFDLRPSVLDDLGLEAAVRWYVARHIEPLGIATRCELEGLETRLRQDVETPVFRAVQEALTNVARHSRATSVLIQMRREDGALTVDVEDDGVGFIPSEIAQPAESGRGLGLLGMRERIENLGGTLAIDSAPGEGTHVSFRVPL